MNYKHWVRPKEWEITYALGDRKGYETYITVIKSQVPPCTWYPVLRYNIQVTDIYYEI